jgi:hypothetical protein
MIPCQELFSPMRGYFIFLKTISIYCFLMLTGWYFRAEKCKTYGRAIV